MSAGAGSGGRIAIYSTSNTFAGAVTAYGGSSFYPAAAGTIYLQTGAAGSVYRKLVVANNGYAATEGQRTHLSDTAPSGSNVTYVLDELYLGGSAQFGLKPANSDAAIRTVLRVGVLTGDGSGFLHAVANTQIDISIGPSTQLIQSSTFVDPYSVPFQTVQSTTAQYVTSSLFLNTSSIYVYSSGRLSLPSSVSVAGSETIRCQGDLLGISSLSVLESGAFSIYSSCRSSLSYSGNFFQVSDVVLAQSGSLSLVHDKTVTTSLVFAVSSGLTMLDASSVQVTGLAKLQTSVFNMSSSQSSVSGFIGGFTPGMTNTFCPQTVGGSNNQGRR